MKLWLRTAPLGLMLLVLVHSTSGQAPPGSAAAVPPPGPVFSAFEKAYPRWVMAVDAFEGPYLAVGGQRFAWAEGRLLPDHLAQDWSLYSPQPFYEYPAQEPDVSQWTDEMVFAAEARLAGRRSSLLHRSSAFFDALWGVKDRGSADDQQTRISFIGLPVTVHRSLVEPLKRVEGRLRKAREGDAELDAFLRTLVRLEGFNWRPIAETQSRSNHAYGAAIDVIPRSWKGRNPYWLWAEQDHPGWYRDAWKERWQPHPGLVQAFEAEGFVWGGKWLLFDTIHFEYRPEILILNGLR